jgi:hydroxyacylglutathione hydrolase
VALIGLERAAGYWETDAIDAWRAAGGHAGAVAQVDAAEVARHIDAGGAAVVDVRGAAEWEAGHLPGVPNIPLAYLSERMSEIPRDRPVVVQCQGGARSAMAASVLKAHGFEDVANMTGGYAAWQAAGLPVEVGEPDLATRQT